ncbi:unnamed protein product [Euphydryas editha]|uniref:Uncharacterized protein n=1 Tax=Euphydryas editha TaxID=104508 RepID=A0AAU9TIA1_EUPED|nr:unnamed protein product [Euphydryas editha]
MRTRKKPDLRLDIPSYPHDYVEMPAETRRLIHEANRPSNDIQYIDDDNSKAELKFQVGSPISANKLEFRSSTPEVKITGPEDDEKDKKQVILPSENEDSPILHRDFNRASVSVPDKLRHYQGTDTNKQNNVSLLSFP